MALTLADATAPLAVAVPAAVAAAAGGDAPTVSVSMAGGVALAWWLRRAVAASDARLTDALRTMRESCARLEAEVQGLRIARHTQAEVLGHIRERLATLETAHAYGVRTPRGNRGATQASGGTSAGGSDDGAADS